jgi:hypothetical protein
VLPNVLTRTHAVKVNIKTAVLYTVPDGHFAVAAANPADERIKRGLAVFRVVYIALFLAASSLQNAKCLRFRAACC